MTFQDEVLQQLQLLGPFFMMTLFVVAVILTVIGRLGGNEEEKKPAAAAEPEEPAEPPAAKPKPMPAAKKPKAAKRGKKQAHPWLASQLGGHTGEVLDIKFSPTGKHLASVSTDRSLRLWAVKDFEKPEHSVVRFNIELDHAVKLDFTPDGKVVVLALAQARKLRVVKLDMKRKSYEVKVETPEKSWTNSPIGCAIHAGDPADPRTGQAYLMGATDQTTLEVRTIKGDLVQQIDTKSGRNRYATKTPDGRFVAVCGYVGVVNFLEVPRLLGPKISSAFATGGHRATVYHCCFSFDSKVCCTVSKDGTWKAWDIDIDYKRGGDPKELATGNYTCFGDDARIDISPDKSVVAVGSGANVHVFNAENGSLIGSIDGAHPDATITGVAFDSEGKYVTTSGTDKHIKVWHNIPGFTVAVNRLGRKLINAKSDAEKQRVQDQIDWRRAIIDKTASK